MLIRTDKYTVACVGHFNACLWRFSSFFSFSKLIISPLPLRKTLRENRSELHIRCRKVFFLGNYESSVRTHLGQYKISEHKQTSFSYNFKKKCTYAHSYFYIQLRIVVKYTFTCVGSFSSLLWQFFHVIKLFSHS